jgi:hypothetical protein
MTWLLQSLQRDYQKAILSGLAFSPEWIAEKPALASVDRLLIYQKTYSVRLIGCLRDDFELLEKAAGSERFHAWAEKYLRTHPSQSYTAADFGNRFCEFLKTEDVELHLLELAQLEWAMVVAAYAPKSFREGLEKKAHATPEEWAKARLKLHPSVRIFKFETAVDVLFDDPRSELVQKTTHLMVSYWKDEPVYEKISASEYEFLRLVQEGRALADVTERVANLDLSPEVFLRWFDEEIFHSILWER